MRTERKQPEETHAGGRGAQAASRAPELSVLLAKVKELQEALLERDEVISDLVAASLSAQEEERQYIAYEVHDRVAQTLASAFQQLQTLELLLREETQARSVAVRASVLLREAIREARNIMNDLHPPALEEFGLVPLMEEELRRFQEDRVTQTRFDADLPERPNRAAEVALYRIFREALTNVRRHAIAARSVNITLTNRNRVICLQIQDDGPGFDVAAALKARRGGWGGLTTMRRRAEIAGGTCDIASSPGQGTSVTVRIPADSHSPPKEGRSND